MADEACVVNARTRNRISEVLNGREGAVAAFLDHHDGEGNVLIFSSQRAFDDSLLALAGQAKLVRLRTLELTRVGAEWVRART